MGNCQAIDAATLVIQHPSGKVENFYWPVSASEVMKMNPGHHVALLMSTTLYSTNNNGKCPNKNATNNTPLRVTRIKLLRPTDTLVLGHVYRLITSQEVMKGLCAKKQAKLKKNEPESEEKLERVKEKQGSGLDTKARRSEQQKENQVTENERSRPKTTTSSTNSASIARSRAWKPSLRSISEAGSQPVAANHVSIISSFHAAQDTRGSNTWAYQQNPGLLQPAKSNTDNPWRRVATETD